MVIGRPGYDNYLVAHAVAERGRVSSVDVTNALVALHQTDDDGVKAGHRARDDHDWNLELIGEQWRDGQTWNCLFRLGGHAARRSWVDEDAAGTYGLQRRYSRHGWINDDTYDPSEMAFFAANIPPGARCLQYASTSVSGVLAGLCESLTVVLWNHDSYRDVQEELSAFDNVRVLYGHGVPQKWQWRMGVRCRMRDHTLRCSRKGFKKYLDVIVQVDAQFDVLINDGRCRPQIAYAISLHAAGRALTTGAALPERRRWANVPP